MIPSHYRSLSALHEWDDNYNINDIFMIARSIRRFGFNSALRVWRDGIVMAGNHTMKALKLIQAEGAKPELDHAWPPENVLAEDDEWFVPFVDVSHLNDMEAKAFAIADNETARKSTVDEVVLAQYLQDIAEQDEQLFTATSFDPDQLDTLIRGLLDQSEAPDDLDDELDEFIDGVSDGSLLALTSITIEEPRHQVEKGDVWKLGIHVLICADVLTGWSEWIRYLEGEETLFAPYPGPFAALTIKAERMRLVMVQPDTYIAGHILDRYSEIKGQPVSTKKRKTGGKTFNPRDGRIYFVASGVNRLKLAADVHDHLLVAVNEIGGPAELARIEDWIAEGKKVFLDSGVYNLAMEHAKKHNISMDTALGTPPEEIDGFQQLFDRYVSLVQRLESGLWGYIEIDMGGRENKIATRAKLEPLGLRPIPVYHPLNDGWDYFDELASHYDRLCFGNIVQADRATRMRLLATMWERHRKYPDLWIHILGLTPNPFMSSYPSNSADSSSWLAAVRWASAMRERAMGASVGAFPVNFRYRYDADANAEDGSHKAVKLSGYWAAMIERNWRNHVQAIEQAGMEIYPHE